MLMGLPIGSLVSAPADLWVPIGRRVASASGQLAFTWLQDFEDVVFRLSNVVAATNDDELIGRTSSDAGVSHDAGASDYEVQTTAISLTTVNLDNFAAATHLRICGDGAVGVGLANTAIIGHSGSVVLERPFATDRFTRMHGIGGFRSGNGSSIIQLIGGARLSTGRVDGFEFSMLSGGNIASGVIDAWGVLPVERAA